MFLAVNRPSYTLQSSPSRLNSCLYESLQLGDLSIFSEDSFPRPCLVATSRSSLKSKRVVFADDKGLPLTQVRVMREPSACPPRWTRDYLDKLTGITSRSNSSQKSFSIWEPVFQQPVSDYLQFRARLDTHNVSLENLLVLEHDQTISGTVKVKNLSFNKLIKVRITFDGWKTFKDIPAAHVPANPFTACAIGSVDLYDTFSFKIKIPETEDLLRRIEVCVCFTCDHGEFWDNNLGQNYVLVKREDSDDSINDKRTIERDEMVKTYKCNDALTARLDTWSEFASWNHLTSDGPYW